MIYFPINVLKKLFSNQLKRKLTNFSESLTKIINFEILKNPQIENIIENDYVDNIQQFTYTSRT